jgi:hypothetical protein
VAHRAQRLQAKQGRQSEKHPFWAAHLVIEPKCTRHRCRSAVEKRENPLTIANQAENVSQSTTVHQMLGSACYSRIEDFMKLL